ncbi:MAG TPA: hypothetical protein VFX58_02930 [Chitinophagaceae bacterium]|nr:hypothetical protein [Chitinophagaceae bacterium]
MEIITLEIDVAAIAIIAVILLGLLIFLVVKNKKDKKEFEDQLNRDYPKTKDEEKDIDTEDPRD